VKRFVTVKANVMNENKKNQFTFLDWIILIGGFVLLLVGLLTIYSNISDLTGLVGGILWVAISIWSIKIKVKKYKQKQI
jgi:uncharacterized membrane-anchored protein